jgi:tetratricopeptide (TPR) repeat protein
MSEKDDKKMNKAIVSSGAASEKAQFKKEEQDMLELGKFYFLSGNYSEALEHFNRTLSMNKNNSEALYNIGLIYEHQHLREEAQKMFERALALNPGYKLAQGHLNRLKGLK